MPEITKHQPGTFCWLTLNTSDAAGAKKFYSNLFDWATEDVPAGEGMTYTLLRMRGRDVAGLSQMDPSQCAPGQEPPPPHWFTFVAARSAAETARKAGSLGGTIMMEAADVLDVGRMAVIQDPSGGIFGLWEPLAHPGAGVMNEPGSLCWTELMTHDPAKADVFYRGLFGWSKQTMDMGAPDPYTMFEHGGRPAAGMMKITPDMGPMPSNWMVYFQVNDCEHTAKRVGELGGQILVPPSDAPGVGRFAVAQDPQGAVFAFIRMNPPA